MNKVQLLSLVAILNQRKIIPGFSLFSSGFLAFRKDLTPEETTERLTGLEDQGSDFNRIRCPLCQWQPQASSRWYCTNYQYPEYFFNGCGTVWNTFTTYGLCPGCGHQWRWTTCLRCHRWSLHEAWYVTE
jgi:hypothetical protein